MKNILIGIDFKDEPDVIIEKAVELANKFQSKIWLLHAVAPEPDFIGYDAGPDSVRNFRAEELKNENNLLSNYAKQLKDKGYKADALLIMGATAATILSEAEKLQADLIILGHHEHGFLYKVLFGDTASEVIKKAKIPVLLVPC